MEKDNLKIFKNIKSVHFIGIGGISMNALAKYCLAKNIKVTGSDLVKSNLTSRLEEKGVKIFYDHKARNISDCDLVVFSSAISPANLELIEAKAKGILTIERGEMLGLISKQFARTISIAGTHGKTTTTALLAKIFLDAKISPMVHMGGEVDFLDSNFYFGGSLLLTEACEYKSSFLHLKNYLGAILNVESEHLDYFKTFSNEINEFIKFANNSNYVFCDVNFMQILIKNNFSPKKIITIGTKKDDKDAMWQARNISQIKIGGYVFDCYYNGEFYAKIVTNILGEHNIINILFAIAISHFIGISKSQIKKSILEFNGVKRRLEKLGNYKTTTVIADYAHHPTEISACIKTISETFKNNILLIFQPHTYSRTLTLMQEFINVLKETESDLIILPTYKARERAKDGITAKQLFKKLAFLKSNAMYKSKQDCISFIKKYYHNYSTIVFIGAGDIYDLAQILLKK